MILFEQCFSSHKTNISIDQLLKETEKEAPKAAPKPPQKSADSSDDDFVSDDDEGMIFKIIARVWLVYTLFQWHLIRWTISYALVQER